MTRADYEKLVLGFDRASGALATGVSPSSEKSGRDVARLLALVSAAEDRKIDQDPVMQSTIRVRGYVLLANSLLVHLKEEIGKDEQGTRTFWQSEQHNYVQVNAGHILIRFKGVKSDKLDAAGLSRSEAEAKSLADSLYQRLKSGADFATLAKQTSEDESTAKLGGVLPPFTRGMMLAEFEIAAYATPVGGISEPIRTKYGYHLIRVNQRAPLPYEKVRAALIDLRARELFEEIGSSKVELNNSYFQK